MTVVEVVPITCGVSLHRARRRTVRHLPRWSRSRCSARCSALRRSIGRSRGCFSAMSAACRSACCCSGCCCSSPAAAICAPRCCCRSIISPTPRSRCCGGSRGEADHAGAPQPFLSACHRRAAFGAGCHRARCRCQRRAGDPCACVVWKHIRSPSTLSRLSSALSSVAALLLSLWRGANADARPRHRRDRICRAGAGARADASAASACARPCASARCRNSRRASKSCSMATSRTRSTGRRWSPAATPSCISPASRMSGRTFPTRVTIASTIAPRLTSRKRRNRGRREIHLRVVHPRAERSGGGSRPDRRRRPAADRCLWHLETRRRNGGAGIARALYDPAPGADLRRRRQRQSRGARAVSPRRRGRCRSARCRTSVRCSASTA